MPTHLPPRRPDEWADWRASARASALFVLVASGVCLILLPSAVWLPALSGILFCSALVVAIVGRSAPRCLQAGSSLAFLGAAAAVFSDDASIAGLFADAAPAQRR